MDHDQVVEGGLRRRNDCRAARMEIGGGGTDVHAHDGPYNVLAENYARVLRVLKANDRENRLLENWYVEPTVDRGTSATHDRNRQKPRGWDEFPFSEYCGHDHRQTAETARPS